MNPIQILALLAQVTSIVKTHHYKVVRIAVHLLFKISLLLVTHDSTEQTNDGAMKLLLLLLLEGLMLLD